MYPQIPVRTKVRIMPYLLLIAAIVSLLPTSSSPSATATEAKGPRVAGSSRFARADIPRPMLAIYRRTGQGATWRTRSGGRYAAWAVLAAIGKVESDHGRSRAPGVRSGVNRFGCCAGPMQFNLRNGPPSTWDAYGKGSPYRAADAVPAARRLLLANGARRNLDGAIWNYNHADWYVAKVKRLARSYQDRRS